MARKKQEIRYRIRVGNYVYFRRTWWAAQLLRLRVGGTVRKFPIRQSR